MYANAGIPTALYERERTGAGSAPDVAMIDALGEWMVQPTYCSVHGERPSRRTGARHASIAPCGPYRAGDDLTVSLAVQNDREWATLCRDVLGRPDLIEDARFLRNTERVQHNDQITTIVEASFATMTADRAVERLDTAGIACAARQTDEPRPVRRRSDEQPITEDEE